MDLRKIVGKRVKVLISFSSKSGATMPTSYEGIIEDVGGYTEGFIFIVVGNHIINAKYIIDIELFD